MSQWEAEKRTRCARLYYDKLLDPATKKGDRGQETATTQHYNLHVRTFGYVMQDAGLCKRSVAPIQRQVRLAHNKDGDKLSGIRTHLIKALRTASRRNQAN